MLRSNVRFKYSYYGTSFLRVSAKLQARVVGKCGRVDEFAPFRPAPFGFAAILGVIALAGIIMRNSVILVDEIQQDLKAGLDTREAIIGETVRPFRPIALTAAAAVLALILLSTSLFWGRWRWWAV